MGLFKQLNFFCLEYRRITAGGKQCFLFGPAELFELIFPLTGCTAAFRMFCMDQLNRSACSGVAGSGGGAVMLLQAPGQIGGDAGLE